MKQSIVLIGMILFILLCNGICAEDENTNSEYEDYFDLGPNEDFMVEIHYETGDLFYHIIAKWRTYSLKNKNSSKPDILYVSFLSVPELSYNFHIFVEGLENKEIEPIVIKTQEELIEAKKSINNQLKNNKELIEFIKKYWGGSEEEIKNYMILDDEYIEGLTEALEEGYELCGFVSPEYLYEKEEFILKIEFDTEIHKSKSLKNKFYMNWFEWYLGIEIENFNHVYFILPQDAYPWWHETANDSFKKKERNVLRWDVQEMPITEDKKIYIGATFGTLEERLHWENHVNNIENFIYLIVGILLAIVLAVVFGNINKKYNLWLWLSKPFILILILKFFRDLFIKRIENFDLREIPLETCLWGECLADEIDKVLEWTDRISKFLWVIQIICILYAIFLIFRFLRNRTEERSEQEVENSAQEVELEEEEVTEGTQELKGVSEEKKKQKSKSKEKVSKEKPKKEKSKEKI